MNNKNRAYYSNKVSNFLSSDNNEILGEILSKSCFSDNLNQKKSWEEQIKILKNSLKNFHNAFIYFEFTVPRIGKRIDNIIILDGIIYILEFKINSKKFYNNDEEQVIDYALDLRNFHEGSHDKIIIPILISTEAENNSFDDNCIMIKDNICICLKANKDNLSSVISSINAKYKQNDFDINLWEKSSYKPTPTIIEAAKYLYANHSVENITHNEAGAKNLLLTTNIVKEIIESSKKNNRKSICFITGVPGSGKTLAGLNIASQSMNYQEDEHACFLSGNGPLVKVLREAIVRNKTNLSKDTSKKDIEAEVNVFIQNIHHFRDEYMHDNIPLEKIVIFDEAQRAWDKTKLSKFMKDKKDTENFNQSEPEFLIKIMNRHKDWCVIICLIGEGQEIYQGEAGIEEWFKALENKFTDWDIYSPYIINNIPIINDCIKIRADLHLNVSLRSFRSEKLSDFIYNVIENKTEKSKQIYKKLIKKYPIYITRNISNAKKFIKDKAMGSERIGIISHSNALRLKAEGIFVKSEIDVVNWFLNPSKDIRSSNALEDAATEFDIQGLELDFAIVAWDANLIYENDNWVYRKFSGTKWSNIKNPIQQKYLLNAYRVLLTRARQGMVIFIPEGSDDDKTRLKNFYNGVYNYLKTCGINDLENIF